MKKTLCLTAIAAGLTLSLYAQDPEFTQFYANPVYLNPALSGTRVCPRIQLNYRNQWPAISGNFVTTGFSFDKKLFKASGGLGIVATNDRAGRGTLNSTMIGAAYAYHQKLSKNISISAALQASFLQKSIDWDKLTFGDMIDPRLGPSRPTQEQGGDNTTRNVDFSSGLLIYSNTFYAGFAVHHIFEPNESLLNGDSPLPRKYTAHGGARIKLGNQHSGESSISPNVMYRQQGDFKQLNLGMYVQKGVLVGGLWYRGKDAFIVLLGLEKDQFRMGYSYDVTVSKLTNATAGSHEVSVGYHFECKPPKKNYRPDFCPSF